MTKSSCIEHLSQKSIVMIREDYVELCVEAPDPNCAAAMMNLFEHFTNWKLANSEHAKKQNDIAESGDLERSQYEDLWIWKTTAEFHEDLMGIWGTTKIEAARKWLVEVGYLQQRNNPYHNWDKTYQYLYDIEAVNLSLQRLKNKPAIPEITEEPTRKDSLLPPASTGKSDDDNQKITNPKTQPDCGGCPATDCIHYDATRDYHCQLTGLVCSYAVADDEPAKGMRDRMTAEHWEGLALIVGGGVGFPPDTEIVSDLVEWQYLQYIGDDIEPGILASSVMLEIPDKHLTLGSRQWLAKEHPDLKRGLLEGQEDEHEIATSPINGLPLALFGKCELCGNDNAKLSPLVNGGAKCHLCGGIIPEREYDVVKRGRPRTPAAGQQDELECAICKTATPHTKTDKFGWVCDLCQTSHNISIGHRSPTVEAGLREMATVASRNVTPSLNAEEKKILDALSLKHRAVLARLHVAKLTSASVAQDTRPIIDTLLKHELLRAINTDGQKDTYALSERGERWAAALPETVLQQAQDTIAAAKAKKQRKDKKQVYFDVTLNNPECASEYYELCALFHLDEHVCNTNALKIAKGYAVQEGAADIHLMHTYCGSQAWGQDEDGNEMVTLNMMNICPKDGKPDRLSLARKHALNNAKSKGHAVELTVATGIEDGE